MKSILSVFFAVCFFVASSSAQWTAVNTNLGSLKVTGLARIGSTIYAATADQGLFTSANNGDSWSAYTNNASLPSLVINGLEGDPISAQGISIYTQNGFALLQSSLSVPPWSTLPNKDVTLYRQYQNPSRRFIGTKNSGLFYTDDDATWNEVTGIPAGASKNIRGIMSQEANVLILVGTENGAFKSTDRGVTWSAANAGLSGDALKINNMFSFFAITSGGIYLAQLSAFTAWFPAVPTGDFRACTADMATMQYYFFGNNIGALINLATSQVGSVPVGGISGGVITSAVLSGTTIFVGTETGGVFRAQVSSLTDVNDGKELPNEFSLAQNYPNPFNPSTTIAYSVPAAGNVTLKVFDLLGNEIATLVNGEMSRGTYSVQFDGSKVASGLYFYRLQVGSKIETKKMLLTK